MLYRTSKRLAAFCFLFRGRNASPSAGSAVILSGSYNKLTLLERDNIHLGVNI